METKLTDFSNEELKDAYVAIAMYEGKTKDEKVKENLQLWMTQIVQAAAHVKVGDNIIMN